MSFVITFNKEEFECVISLNEPEYIAKKGKKAFKAYIDSIGKKNFEEQVNRIKKVSNDKCQSYLSLETSLAANEGFLSSKRNRGFALLLNGTDDDKKIGESIDRFYKYILEECSVTFH